MSLSAYLIAHVSSSLSNCYCFCKPPLLLMSMSACPIVILCQPVLLLMSLPSLPIVHVSASPVILFMSLSVCPIGQFSASLPYRSYLCQSVRYTCLCQHILFQMSLAACPNTNVPTMCHPVVLIYNKCVQEYKHICNTFQHFFFSWPYIAYTKLI